MSDECVCGKPKSPGHYWSTNGYATCRRGAAKDRAREEGNHADRSRLHRKANEVLDRSLAEGEQVLAIITGPSSQAIIGTDRRLFVYKRGFMAGATLGAEITTFDYRNLGGVQIHTGMMSGAVVLQGPGLPGTNTSYWKSGEGDPYKAPNAIPLVRPYDQAEAGVARLRALISAAHSKAQVTTTQTSSSLVDELQKLAELRDSGVLSEEEFTSAKRNLLSP